MRPDWFGAGMISYPTPVVHRKENVEAWFVALVGVGLVRIERRHSTDDVIAKISERRPLYP